MPRLSALGGFQTGIVAIMITYAVIALIQPADLKASVGRQPVQDEIAAPPSK